MAEEIKMDEFEIDDESFYGICDGISKMKKLLQESNERQAKAMDEIRFLTGRVLPHIRVVRKEELDQCSLNIEKKSGNFSPQLWIGVNEPKKANEDPTIECSLVVDQRNDELSNCWKTKFQSEHVCLKIANVIETEGDNKEGPQCTPELTLTSCSGEFLLNSSPNLSNTYHQLASGNLSINASHNDLKIIVEDGRECSIEILVESHGLQVFDEMLVRKGYTDFDFASHQSCNMLGNMHVPFDEGMMGAENEEGQFIEVVNELHEVEVLDKMPKRKDQHNNAVVIGNHELEVFDQMFGRKEQYTQAVSKSNELKTFGEMILHYMIEKFLRYFEGDSPNKIPIPCGFKDVGNNILGIFGVSIPKSSVGDFVYKQSSTNNGVEEQSHLPLPLPEPPPYLEVWIPVEHMNLKMGGQMLQQAVEELEEHFREKFGKWNWLIGEPRQRRGVIREFTFCELIGAEKCSNFLYEEVSAKEDFGVIILGGLIFIAAAFPSLQSLRTRIVLRGGNCNNPFCAILSLVCCCSFFSTGTKT